MPSFRPERSYVRAAVAYSKTLKDIETTLKMVLGSFSSLALVLCNPHHCRLDLCSAGWATATRGSVRKRTHLERKSDGGKIDACKNVRGQFTHVLHSYTVRNEDKNTAASWRAFRDGLLQQHFPRGNEVLLRLCSTRGHWFAEQQISTADITLRVVGVEVQWGGAEETTSKEFLELFAHKTWTDTVTLSELLTYTHRAGKKGEWFLASLCYHISKYVENRVVADLDPSSAATVDTTLARTQTRRQRQGARRAALHRFALRTKVQLQDVTWSNLLQVLLAARQRWHSLTHITLAVDIGSSGGKKRLLSVLCDASNVAVWGPPQASAISIGHIRNS
eukprot:5611117-Amphidinium_carterae.2